MRKKVKGPKRWECLINMIRKNGYTVGAEIGVHRGHTTFKLLAAIPNLKLVVVDSWENIPDDPTDTEYRQIGLEGTNQQRARTMFESKARKLVRDNRLKILVGDSVEMAEKVKDGSLDFVFIDADHRHFAALADIKAWTPKVRDGGTVSGHDYDHPRFPGVTKAVHECFGENIVDTKVDYVWAAKKDDFLL